MWHSIALANNRESTALPTEKQAIFAGELETGSACKIGGKALSFFCQTPFFVHSLAYLLLRTIMSAPSLLAPFDSSLVSDLLAKVNRHGKCFEAAESGAHEGIIASCLSLSLHSRIPAKVVSSGFSGHKSVPSFLVKSVSEEAPPSPPTTLLFALQFS